MVDKPEDDEPIQDATIEGIVDLVISAEAFAEVMGCKVHEALRTQLKALQVMQTMKKIRGVTQMLDFLQTKTKGIQ